MDFNGIQCFYTNADSLPNKLGELMTRIQDGKNSYEVIGITEIYPKNCRYIPGKAELQIEGYELFLSESTSFSKRGAALYINKKLKSEEIKFKEKFEESVWAQIKLNNNDMLLLGCIYKSPSSSPENLDELNKLLITISKEKKFSHIMVMGDFNFPKIDWKNWLTKGDKISENFVESIRDSYMFQHVMENTRMRENCEPSTLDLILTNDENMIEELNYTSPLGNSDHCSLEFILKCYCEKKSCKTERWNYFKGDYTNMNTFLQCDWNDILKGKNAGKQFDIFMTKFNEAKIKYIPHMNTKANNKAKKHNYIPLDVKTAQKIKKKHRCWTRYRETGDNKKYQEYAKTRNQVKSAIRKAKANMEKEIAQSAKSNPKIFWKYANSKRKTNTGISELKFKSEEGEERKTTTDKEKSGSPG